VRNTFLTITAVGLAALGLHLLVSAPGTGALVSALSLVFIWGIAAVSLNLINGQLGILSLGHHGFMLIGGYTTALLMLPAAERAPERTRLLSDWARHNLSLDTWLHGLRLDFLATSVDAKFVIALLIAGLFAALVGLVVGIPSLRIRGDYLAIVTFGFGEIIRLLPNAPEVAAFTNGPLGLKGVPGQAGGIWWTFIVLLIVIFVLSRLKFSSYGRALAGIREDEIAAQAMGVNLSYHKVFAFALSAFFAGVAGGLYTSYLQSVDTQTFNFFVTFYLLVAISLGGLGSITGAVLGTAVVVFIRFYGGFLEEQYSLAVGGYVMGGLFISAFAFTYLVRRARRLRPLLQPQHYLVGALGAIMILGTLFFHNAELFEGQIRFFGMRRILLAVVLILAMIYLREGLMGRAEFAWQRIFGPRQAAPTDEERLQDAWLKKDDDARG
jgi:branched-chain amino acid transport system permease protein